MENKTGKYFKYAIGEIVLVVIGILIALQINNWNETRKENNLKENYYQQLLTDLEADKHYAKRNISIIDSSLTKINEYEKSFTTPNLRIDQVLVNLGKTGWIIIDLEYKTSTIETLINTGDIRLFKPQLRDLLTKYNKGKTQTVKLSRFNKQDANDLLKKASSLGGALLSTQRLQNQAQLMNLLNIEDRLPEIYLAMESYLIWKSTIQKITSEALNGDIDLANKIIKEIKSEINN